MHDLKNLLGPVSDDKERGVRVVEERNVQDAAVPLDELLQANPLFLIYVLVYHVDLFVLSGEADLLLEFAYVSEDVHLHRIEGVHLVLELGAHQVPMDLELQLQMLLVGFAVG